jgi:hypothetical protein
VLGSGLLQQQRQPLVVRHAASQRDQVAYFPLPLMASDLLSESHSASERGPWAPREQWQTAREAQSAEAEQAAVHALEEAAAMVGKTWPTAQFASGCWRNESSASSLSTTSETETAEKNCSPRVRKHRSEVSTTAIVLI